MHRYQRLAQYTTPGGLYVHLSTLNIKLLFKFVCSSNSGNPITLFTILLGFMCTEMGLHCLNLIKCIFNMSSVCGQHTLMYIRIAYTLVKNNFVTGVQHFRDGRNTYEWWEILWVSIQLKRRIFDTSAFLQDHGDVIRRFNLIISITGIDK